ncbi:transposase domain-containing protein [Streptomyces niveus]
MTDHRATLDGSLLHRIPVALLNREFPPHLVDEAVKHSRRGPQRNRVLSPQLMTYFTMGMWLYPDRAYTDVARHLADGLTWARGRSDTENSWGAVTDGALSRAREKLGPGPLRVLFSGSTSSGRAAATAGGCWRGLRLASVDTFRLDMPKTAANEAVFGGAPDRTLPSVHVTVLADSHSRRLLDATMEPLPPGAATGPGRHPVLGPDTLLLGDCRRTDFDFLTTAAAASTAVLCGAPADRDLPAAEHLRDGTYLSEVPGAYGEHVTVRVMRTGPHAADGPLCTTLLDPAEAPAPELVQHYTSRWRVGRLTHVLPTTGNSHYTALRSRHPWGVEQEVWAMLCAYQALCGVIAASSV